MVKKQSCLLCQNLKVSTSASLKTGEFFLKLGAENTFHFLLTDVLLNNWLLWDPALIYNFLELANNSSIFKQGKS